MIEFKAPNKVDYDNVTVFLAGSIEMGGAEDWQSVAVRELADYDVHILNPRRFNWDASWEQKITNSQFKEQVEWELSGLDEADIIFMNFVPGTKSPITLLEFGLVVGAHSAKSFEPDSNIVICCPDGFWRKGNIDVTCSFFGMKQPHTSFEEALNELKYKISDFKSR